jgi:hypothetical protein
VKEKRWLSILLILSAIIFLSACEEEFNNVGMELQPPGDRLTVKTTDTLSVYAYSTLVDSIRTDETSVSLMGSIYDPIFGTTTANVYSQFRLSETAFSFGENPVVDSLVLTLDYKKLWGDTNAILTMQVYEIKEQFYKDSAYTSNISLDYDPTLIATTTFNPNLTDSIIFGSDSIKLKPHFRLNLSKTNPVLAQKLIGASSDDMNTQDAFQEYFYGLYIKFTDVNTGGAIFAVNLLSTWSEMTLYYKNDEEDSLSFDYIISAYAAYFGEFRHNYTMAEPGFKKQVVDGDTSLGKNTLYVQTMAGVKSYLKFPYLKNIDDNAGIMINEARMFITTPELDPYLDPPNTLVLVKSDGEGGYDIMTDQAVGDDYYGGVYDSVSRGYWFRITETVQEMLLSDDPDYGFELYISGGSVICSRGILNGFDPIEPVPYDDRIRLVITHTALSD